MNVNWFILKPYYRVDESRIKDVGPDRAAAEWLLRCGAGVRWKDHESTLKDYNSLPPGGYRSLYIEEIDATESCIMSAGFPHLSNTLHLPSIGQSSRQFLSSPQEG